MGGPFQVPALEGNRPKTDNADRWKVADPSTDPQAKRERLSIAVFLRWVGGLPPEGRPPPVVPLTRS